jgi:hypothetical protein
MRPWQTRAVSVAIALVVTLFALVGAGLLVDWIALKRARAFCESIPVGSNVPDAVARARAEHIPSASSGDYRAFYFQGLVFNKAVCELRVRNDDTVLQKEAVMQYD